MDLNLTQNPRNPSNRGLQSMEVIKNDFITLIDGFDQEKENEIFSNLLGLDEYCNMGIPSGWY